MEEYGRGVWTGRVEGRQRERSGDQLEVNPGAWEGSMLITLGLRGGRNLPQHDDARAVISLEPAPVT